MTKTKINFTMELYGEFTKGCCSSCPLSYDKCYDSDDGFEYITRCVLECSPDQCPLEVSVEEEYVSYD